MWKWIFGGLAAIVVIFVLLGIYGWNQLSKPIDPNTPEGQAYGDAVQQQMAELCKREMPSTLPAANAEQIADLCSCFAASVYQEYKNEPPTKLITITTDPAASQRINEFRQECAQRAGIE